MRKALTLGGLVAAALAVQYASAPTDRVSGNTTPVAVAPVAIDERDLHVGPVFESDRVQHSLVITNTGGSPATIKRVAATCDCTDIVPAGGFCLQAGEARRVSMAISLPASMPPTADSPLSADTVLTIVRVQYEVDGKRGTTIQRKVRGTLLTTCTIRPQAVDLGTILQRDAAARATVDIDVPDYVAGIECEPPAGWRASIETPYKTFQPGRYRVTLCNAVPLAVRRINTAMTITPSHNDGRRLPAKVVRVTGEVVGDIAASPPAVYFGRIPLGGRTDEAVRLYSRTGTPFRVDGVETSDGRLAVEAVEGQTAMYALRFKVDQIGEQAAVATFNVVDDSGRRAKVPVEVRVLGYRTEEAAK